MFSPYITVWVMGMAVGMDEGREVRVGFFMWDTVWSGGWRSSEAPLARLQSLGVSPHAHAAAWGMSTLRCMGIGAEQTDQVLAAQTLAEPKGWLIGLR